MFRHNVLTSTGVVYTSQPVSSDEKDKVEGGLKRFGLDHPSKFCVNTEAGTVYLNGSHIVAMYFTEA